MDLLTVRRLHVYNTIVSCTPSGPLGGSVSACPHRPGGTVRTVSAQVDSFRNGKESLLSKYSLWESLRPVCEAELYTTTHAHLRTFIST